jgi:hypothetical protein
MALGKGRRKKAGGRRQGAGGRRQGAGGRRVLAIFYFGYESIL